MGAKSEKVRKMGQRIGGKKLQQYSCTDYINNHGHM
jgi:hypothetical protein